jgi:hypothetical protein
MHKFIEDIAIIKPDKLFFVVNPVDLCRLPYPGHKKGCPNIGRPGCPPDCDRLEKKYNLSKLYFLCYVKFNLKKQKEKMRELHPGWSEKQCKCLLYWQKSVVKELRGKAELFCIDRSQYVNYCGKIEPMIEYQYELIPEAMGLHVFETMKYHGIKLERNPEDYVYKVAFIGVLR